MKTKFFSLALLLMITAAGMWAQNLPGNPASPTPPTGASVTLADIVTFWDSNIWSSNGIWTTNIWSSPQSDTTEGRFRSYADDFIRPDYYSGVKFDKWLGLVSFKTSTYANVGFATKIKGLYIGAFYNGQFWANAPVNNYTESAGSNHRYNNPITVLKVDSSNGQVTHNPINNVAVLIGAANMGFRLAFRTNYQRFNEDDIIVSSTPYNNYKAEYGYLTPQIAWAMAKDLTKNGIRPYAAFDLNIFRNYLKTEEPGTPGEHISKSLNHIDPIFSLGLGGYTFYNKDGFKLSADLDYVLAFNIYNNEYSYSDGSVYRTRKIKGTIYYDSTASDTIYTERFSVFNQVTPSLAGSWSKDRLALKFKLNLVFNFANENQAFMDEDVSHNLFYEGNSDEAFTFTFRPDLRLAMQYKIIPDRLTLNVGARLQASLLTAKTTDRTNYSSGTVTSSKVHNNSMGTDFLTRFSIGLAFNLTENLWTEATAGVSNASTAGSISIFKDDGLFAFGSILVGLKF